jgi:hypothetical protein
LQDGEATAGGKEDGIGRTLRGGSGKFKDEVSEQDGGQKKDEHKTSALGRDG